MTVAQRLYENGYITYMRTDSTTLSDTALAAARAQILEHYGRDYLPDAPRQYTSKVKNAQEAHEAIRPAGDRFRPPEEVQRELQARRVPPLRAGLAAHRRLPDDRRPGPERSGAPRGHGERRP